MDGSIRNSKKLEKTEQEEEIRNSKEVQGKIKRKQSKSIHVGKET